MAPCPHCHDTGYQGGFAAAGKACTECQWGRLVVLIRIVAADDSLKSARKYRQRDQVAVCTKRLRAAIDEARVISDRISTRVREG
jgi:hypothetical protein